MRKLQIVLLSLLCFSELAFALGFYDKQVGILRSPDGRPCFLFQLVGVPEADPLMRASPWFAIRNTQVGYKEMLGMILSAKLSGTNIHVDTTGTIFPECGHAGVSVIHIP